MGDICQDHWKLSLAESNGEFTGRARSREIGVPLKYSVAATVLKLFSTSSQTRSIYRYIGNALSDRLLVDPFTPSAARTKLSFTAELFLEPLERFITEDDRLLELGTGWYHWYSTVIGLFHDVDITLFDVCDNRQLRRLKHVFAQLDRVIDVEIRMSKEQRDRVHCILSAIADVKSFDELYQLLRREYILNPNGTLDHFANGSYDAIFSGDVLEHVQEDILQQYTQDFYRLLKPGGYSMHLIGLTDHLYRYDHAVSVKNYLRYTDEKWKRHFENKVQYINRIQRPEWLKLFGDAGLKLVEEKVFCTNIGNIRVAEKWKNLSRRDLECVGLWCVHRKL